MDDGFQAENLPPPTLIRRPAELRHLVEKLKSVTRLAVDTESNSLYAYREQVCLVQFSTGEEDYLVDPLELDDLGPLGGVFADEGIEKVFHAAEYDLLCLRRDFGFEFANLFDTMIAARILGREAVGLGAVLEDEFAVHLDKRYQRADWGQRPLPAHLLDYARLDTHYLIALRQRLAENLRSAGMWALAQEDFARLCAMKGTEDDGHAPGGAVDVSCWRVSGAYDLSPQQAAVLQELCRYRDQVARQANRPLFKVIGDHTLLAIAAETPHKLGELSQLPGMTPGQVRRHGAQLLQAVQRGLHAEPLYPRRSRRPDERFTERLDLLRRWRKEVAAQMGVPSDVVLPRDLLHSLAEKNPNQPEALAKVLEGAPWRLEHFGEQILRVLARRV